MLSKVMLKTLQARLQQCVNQELPDVQAGFRKGRGTRDQIANIRWIMEKEREFQKNIYFCFIDYAKAFDCVDHNKLWKILKSINSLMNLKRKLLRQISLVISLMARIFRQQSVSQNMIQKLTKMSTMYSNALIKKCT